MGFLRPEVIAAARRWREVLISAAVALLGVWVVVQGGPFLLLVGLAIAALGAGLALIGWRRLRFAQGVHDPGVVQVLEGQITYFGPTEGGFAGLSALTEITLTRHAGRRVWRLSQSGGEVLYIPTAAEGADALFDAFAGLPGLDTSVLLAAISGPPEIARIVWRRRNARVLH